jgi:hypothetical protein
MLLVIANAGGVSRYADATAVQLLERTGYISAVLGAEPVPAARAPRAGVAKP